MKKRYEDGGEVDAMEEANKAFEANKRPLKEMGDAGTAEEAGQFGDAGSSRTVKATPKPARKSEPKSKSVSKSESKTKSDSVDETKMSLAERAKMSRERARAGSGPTDTRSVGERIRSALGVGKDRGGNTVDFAGSGMGMKSGGSVSSASRRADGIASKGKTRCKMC